MATPVRKQYLEMKERYPDALLLFRMGDFYETFDEDARVAARDLEIVLTQRDMGQGEKVPLAGIPYHALDSHLGKLIRKGHRVAICEQTSVPDGKTLVDRDVVRVVTPGTLLELGLLDQGSNNYLAAVSVDGAQAGIAYVDITTGEFGVTEVDTEDVEAELGRIAPSEVLRPGLSMGPLLPLSDSNVSYTITELPDSFFLPSRARRRLLEHFGVPSLEPYGCDGLRLATTAAGAIVEYLSETHQATLPQLSSLHTYSTGSFMALDPQTRRNLELFEGGRWGGIEHSLLHVLDLTETSMGARLLRRWLGQPLLKLEELCRRQDAVAWMHDSDVRRLGVTSALKEVSDLERVLHRIGAGVAMPREVAALRRSLEQVPSLKDALGKELEWLNADLDPCVDVVVLVTAAIADDPQGDVGGGRVVREGFNADLDELRSASQNARSYIAGLERSEREKTGIPNLKVGYNKVFGYYLEVTNPQLAKVPEDYVRRQTLVNAERFITPELKEYENKVLNAGERMEELEGVLFRQVCRQITDASAHISATASAIAMVDVFVALGEAAVRYNYVRPLLDEGEMLAIKGGRHPVVERSVPAGTFVPNDSRLSTDGDAVIVLTGPNMAGKSTYLRQVAIAALMAQMGSFVAADEAHVGLVDRIFTRVGLQDDLAAGQSTFMVEMVETAAILHHATKRSLVILDEIGRGTSTYDGMSIAQAVVEHVHNDPRLGCRTLFATHYHELTELANRLSGVANFNVAVSEEDGDVVFLHRIVPGGADRSYGVHVAQMAGLPKPVVQRATELLEQLERSGPPRSLGLVYGDGDAADASRKATGADPTHPTDGAQISFFSAAPFEESAVEEMLRQIDVNSLTPLEALNKLYELQQEMKGD